MNRVICIWLPEWPVQRLLVARPELNATPVVLHTRDPRRGRLVVACCHQARAWGVRPGIPLAEVASLAGRKGTIERVEYQPQDDRDTLAELAAWCECFSPIVGIEEGASPSSLLLDATGLDQHFGGEQAWARQIVRQFAQRGYLVRLAFAPTIGSAWGLAHFATPTHPTCNSGNTCDCCNSGQSCNSGDSDKESTHVWISHEPSHDLAPLPIGALRIPDENIGVLHELGVVTIGGLLLLPRSGLATRLGPTLIRRLDQALGRLPEMITSHRPAVEFQAVWPLEHPTDRRDVIERILHDLCGQLAQLLLAEDQAAVQLEAWLDGVQQEHLLRIGLYQPNCSAKHWFDLFRLRLEAVQMRTLIHRVRLLAVTTVKLIPRQRLLWEDAGQSLPDEVAQLVDRLQSRLGIDRVYGVQSQAGALPERAYRPLPFHHHSLRRTTSRSGKESARGLPSEANAQSPRSQAEPRPHQRPVSLVTTPWPIIPVMSTSDGSERSGPPASFQYQNCRYQITQAWGPERIETGWWRGRSVRRDYYRVETSTGARLWLFQQLNDGRWFLHGGFD